MLLFKFKITVNIKKEVSYDEGIFRNTPSLILLFDMSHVVLTR